MRLLRAAGRPPDHIAHDLRADAAGLARDLPRELDRPRQHPLGGQHLAEQSVQEPVARPIDAADGDQVQRPGVPDEPRQEERAAGFHDDAAAGEDEADLGGGGGEPDGCGQGHSYADAHRGAVESGDGGFGGVVDREGDAAAAGEGGI